MIYFGHVDYFDVILKFFLKFVYEDLLFLNFGSFRVLFDFLKFLVFIVDFFF